MVNKIRFFVLQLAIILLGVSSWAMAQDFTKGVFDLVGSGKSFDPIALQSPYVIGGVARTFWSTVEPTEKSYNWKYLDDSLAAAKGYGKQVTIFVACGINTPKWVYDAGAKPFTFKDTNPYHTTYNQNLTMPLPWDRVFLSKWVQFIKAFGARYDANPTVHHVVLGNPTPYSLEMYMPTTKEDQQLLTNAGFTDDKAYNAWKGIIDAYFKAFPTKSVSISISTVMTGTDLTDRIVSYAVGKYGKRLIVQGSWLSAHTSDKMLSWLKTDAQQSPIGFQMLWGATWNAQTNDRQGDLKTSIDNGVKTGAKFLEIYEADVLNAAFANDIKYAFDQLNR